MAKLRSRAKDYAIDSDEEELNVDKEASIREDIDLHFLDFPGERPPEWMFRYHELDYRLGMVSNPRLPPPPLTHRSTLHIDLPIQHC
jgi:hypothetical protein